MLRPWIGAQTWESLAFLHWRVEPERMRALVPAQLPLDLLDGSAWLGVTPFRVTGNRLRGLPPVPPVDRFPELNVRTYVTVGGRPGIHFFSLDAASWAAVLGARIAYRLPYFPADMACSGAPDGVRYRSVRRAGPAAALVARYRPTGPPFNAVAGSLEHWLTERYCLYVTGRSRLVRRADIAHPPWALRPAEAELERNTMGRPLGLALDGEPHVLFAARQDVCVWPLTLAKGSLSGQSRYSGAEAPSAKAGLDTPLLSASG